MAEVTPIEKFLERIAQHPDKVYLRQPKNGEWTEYTWKQVGDQVHRMASALSAMGIGKGDVIDGLSGELAQDCDTTTAIVDVELQIRSRMHNL